MEWIKLLRLLLLLSIVRYFSAPGNYEHSCISSEKTVIVSSEHQKRENEVKYIGAPTAYYSNSTACFQFAILLSGDVHPNPGPNQEENNRYQHNQDEPGTRRQTRLCYDAATLHSLNTRPHQLLNHHAWMNICNLGIRRNKRTHQGHIAPRKHGIKAPGSTLNSAPPQDDTVYSSTTPENFDDIDNSNQSDEHGFFIDIKLKGLKIAHLNICSLYPKIVDIREKMSNYPFDIIAFSGTHLDESIGNAEIHIKGYSLERRDRNRQGGGVAIYTRNSTIYKRTTEFITKSSC